MESYNLSCMTQVGSGNSLQSVSAPPSTKPKPGRDVPVQLN